MVSSPVLITPKGIAAAERLRRMRPIRRRFRSAAAAAGLGLGVTLFQLALACILSGQIDPCRA